MNKLKATLLQTDIMFKIEMITMNWQYWINPFYKRKELKKLDEEFERLHKIIMED